MTNHTEALTYLDLVDGRDARLDDLNLRAAHVYALLAIADALRDQTVAVDTRTQWGMSNEEAESVIRSIVGPPAHP